MRWVRATAIAATICVAWPVGASQVPSFRSSSDIVPLFVTVSDKDGRLVSGLTRDDFQILDDGFPQPLSLFDSAPQPISLIALLDTSGSMADNLPIVRRACLDLLGRLRADDVVRLGT